MALTAGNVTIKTAGGTYSSWAAFWDDLGNLTGNITCTVDVSEFTEATAPAYVTESLGGFTLHVLPASFPTTTDASTGARFTCNYAGVILDLQMEGAGDVIIEGMVFIEGTSKPNTSIYINAIDAEFNITIRRNIIKGGAAGIWHNDETMNAGTKIYNNIIFDVSNFGLQVGADIASAVIANNTVVACNANCHMGDEELTLENILSYGAVGGLGLCFWNIEILTIGNNNAASDATGEDADWGGGGANNLSSIGDPFNNLAADDFTITTEGVIGKAGKDLSASFTDDFFGVTRVNWTIGACEYISPPPDAPTNVAATDGTHTDRVRITWTKSSGATAYRVYRNGVNVSGTLGDVSTYDHTGATAPTITKGTATASDGTSADYVTLSLAGESANNGASQTYTVYAYNGTWSSVSSGNTGYRGVGSLVKLWYRSAADSDASYSSTGGSADPYNDTGAPENGDGRYYKCYLTATGASAVYSSVDRGYRLSPPAPLFMHQLQFLIGR